MGLGWSPISDPIGYTYAKVFSRDSVCIYLTYAALNKIDVLAADIQNAYLQANSSKKHYVICGAEFGLDNFGKIALIRQTLYGTCSSQRRAVCSHSMVCIVISF